MWKCSVAECERRATRKHFCEKHWWRWRVHGDPLHERDQSGTKNPFYKHGLGGTKAYNVHHNMLARCYDPTHKSYKDYGARGISVCDRWRRSVHAFIADMGEPPPGLTLERINVNGSYEPQNCKWATRTEQARNHRNGKLTHAMARAIRMTYAAGGISQAVLAREYGINQTMVSVVVRNKCWKEASLCGVG